MTKSGEFDDPVQYTFEPLYEIVHFAKIAGSYMPGAAMVVAAHFMGYGNGSIIVIVAIALFSPVFFRIRHIRSIVFGSSMVVIRSVLQDRYVKYTDFDAMLVHHDPLLAGWKNRTAFDQSIEEMRDRGVLGRLN